MVPNSDAFILEEVENLEALAVLPCSGTRRCVRSKSRTWLTTETCAFSQAVHLEKPVSVLQ